MESNLGYFDASSWAQEQWKNSELGDKRRNDRVIRLAIDMLRQPDESLPCQLEEWKD